MGYDIHFNNMHHLTESFDFTLKNFRDLLNSMQYEQIRASEVKIKTVTNEFYMHYDITPETEEKLLEAINKYNADMSKPGEIVDFVNVDQFHHLKLHLDMNFGKLFKNGKTIQHLYMIYYHIIQGYEFPNYMSMYTMPYIIDNRYCIFITFDDEEIFEVDALASENPYDITANLYKLSLKASIFNKNKK